MITVTDVVPPGGWQYTEEATGYQMASLDLLTLKEQIRLHRQGNGLDLSDGWWERVQAEMCAADARFRERHCDPNAVAPVTRRGFVSDDLFKFFKTMKAWGRNKRFQPVAPEIAEARREICRSCPKNIDVKGCTGCQGALRWLGEFMSREEAHAEDGLKNCGVCRCVLRLKVLVPEEALLATVNPAEEYPAHCWMPRGRQMS